MIENSRQKRIRGREIFEITPVVVGGSPTDPKNKTYLTRREHIEACRYWNGVIRELRGQDASLENSQDTHGVSLVKSIR